MQVMVAEEAGTIIPAYISNVDALSAKVQGLEGEPARRHDGLRHGRVHLARSLSAASRGPAAGPRHCIARDGMAERDRRSASMTLGAQPRAEAAGDRARHPSDRLLRGVLRDRDAARRRRADPARPGRDPRGRGRPARGDASQRSGDPALPALACRAAPRRPRHLLCQQHAGRGADRRAARQHAEARRQSPRCSRCRWR